MYNVINQSGFGDGMELFEIIHTEMKTIITLINSNQHKTRNIIPESYRIQCFEKLKYNIMHQE